MSDQNEFSLSGLRMPPCFTDPAVMAKIRKRNPDDIEFGSSESVCGLGPWQGHDVVARDVDGSIYRGSIVSALGTGMLTLRKLQFERMMSLLGLADEAACIVWLDTHGAGDPVVTEALLSDAIAKRDPWSLPEELVGEYNRRIEALA